MPQDNLQPTAGRELFSKFSQLANGFGLDQVIDACVNILLNGIRQNVATRRDAEAKFDEISRRGKENLLSHYDPVTGRRRSVLAFDQTITMGLHVDKDRTRGG